MRPLQPGLTLRSYRLEHLLGFGASGQVWLAKDTKGREVALKACPRRGDDEEQSFRQEFEKLRTLRLPGVVRVLDAGADQGYVFFTMDVARGQAFDAYVQQGVDLSDRVSRAANAGAQVARALASVHRLRLAHRDIKPANIMVDEHGRATVLDFGTARFGAGQDSSDTRAGTVAYMAPEQRVGLPHDHRVDAYALGVTLHQALVGGHPGRWKPGRPRPTLATLGPDMPLAFCWLIDRLLALDPASRLSAEEAEAILAAIAVGDSLAPVPWPSPAAYAGDPAPLLSKSAAVVGRMGSGRRRLIQEARWGWYRKGYRSIAGRCEADRPYGALRDLLAELFAEQDAETRAGLAGPEAGLLKAIWPELPVKVATVAQALPDPEVAARALLAVLQRAAPIAVVLWEIDDADAGSAPILRALARELPESILLWATARGPVAGLPQISPPDWSAASERAVLPDILPPGLWPEPEALGSPLDSCARAWRALARWRGDVGPVSIPSQGLIQLSILDEPFPYAVARALAPDVDRLLLAGHLVARQGPGLPTRSPGASADGDDEVTETSGLFDRGRRLDDTDDVLPEQRLAFADRGSRRIARAALLRPELAHAAAAEAWQRPATSRAGAAGGQPPDPRRPPHAGRPVRRDAPAAGPRQPRRGRSLEPPAEPALWARHRLLQPVRPALCRRRAAAGAGATRGHQGAGAPGQQRRRAGHGGLSAADARRPGRRPRTGHRPGPPLGQRPGPHPARPRRRDAARGGPGPAGQRRPARRGRGLSRGPAHGPRGFGPGQRGDQRRAAGCGPGRGRCAPHPGRGQRRHHPVGWLDLHRPAGRGRAGL